MTAHPRIPALIAFAAVLGLGVGVLAAAGQFRSTDLTHKSMDDLEKMIVGSKDAEVWNAYGDKLRAAGRFADASGAYRKALELRPDFAPARINIALALAQSKNNDAFFTYFQGLYTNYPKVAVDLIGREELKEVAKDSRWEGAQEAAKAQAVD